MRVLLLTVLLAVPVAAQAPAATPPTLAERDRLVLTILQQQVDIATLRLRQAMTELATPGYTVDLVGGQWAYRPTGVPTP